MMMENTWNVLLVEDDSNVRRQVKEYLSGEVFASRKLNISEMDNLSAALNVIRERKADLIILDVYQGEAKPGGEQTGVQILESIRSSGFVPVVLYTALPEGLEGQKSSFVRLVGKEARGLERLSAEIADLFNLRVPQLHRAIINHLDQALCSYMWGFVEKRWTEFRPIIEKPEFLRLVVQRLATTFARRGIDEMTTQVYGMSASRSLVNGENVHPAEYYSKPPIGEDPVLGDIRVRDEGDGGKSYFLVLWPSCDMVSIGGRSPKTERVLCAKASQADEIPEIRKWRNSQSKTNEKKVVELIKNNRDKSVGSPDRYHFLPGVWEIPALVVDFQALEYMELSKVKELCCLATLASPFAESLGARFSRYLSRLGTPDLDIGVVIDSLRQQQKLTEEDSG